jgi:hypothetical protein
MTSSPVWLEAATAGNQDFKKRLFDALNSVVDLSVLTGAFAVPVSLRLYCTLVLNPAAVFDKTSER